MLLTAVIVLKYICVWRRGREQVRDEAARGINVFLKVAIASITQKSE